MQQNIISICPLTSQKCTRWTHIATQRQEENRVRVVFAHQFISSHYKSEDLKFNCQKLIDRVAQNFPDITIDFEALSSDAVGHVFCGICEKIQAADIMICEMTEKNPNVYLECGLAIGSNTLISVLTKENCHFLASDILGMFCLTWTNNANNELEINSDAPIKISGLVQRVIAQKRGEQVSSLNTLPRDPDSGSLLRIIHGNIIREYKGIFGKAPKDYRMDYHVVLKRELMDGLGIENGTTVKVVCDKTQRQVEAKLSVVDWNDTVLGLNGHVRKYLGIEFSNVPEESIRSRSGHQITLIIDRTTP